MIPSTDKDDVDLFFYEVYETDDHFPLWIIFFFLDFVLTFAVLNPQNARQKKTNVLSADRSQCHCGGNSSGYNKWWRKECGLAARGKYYELMYT